MNKWITVLTFNLPQQMWVIRTRLEAEGIECFAQDELTIQPDNFEDSVRQQQSDFVYATHFFKIGHFFSITDEAVSLL